VRKRRREAHDRSLARLAVTIASIRQDDLTLLVTIAILSRHCAASTPSRASMR
jgi:hypothetical protein